MPWHAVSASPCLSLWAMPPPRPSRSTVSKRVLRAPPVLQYPLCISLLASGRVDVTPLITHRWKTAWAAQKGAHLLGAAQAVQRWRLSLPGCARACTLAGSAAVLPASAGPGPALSSVRRDRAATSPPVAPPHVHAPVGLGSARRACSRASRRRTWQTPRARSRSCSTSDMPTGCALGMAGFAQRSTAARLGCWGSMGNAAEDGIGIAIFPGRCLVPAASATSQIHLRRCQNAGQGACCVREHLSSSAAWIL